jgi:uncharacterized protein YjbI with pentapeptide repeats
MGMGMPTFIRLSPPFCLSIFPLNFLGCGVSLRGRLIYKYMSLLSGVALLTTESLFHPLSGSQLVETSSGYVAIRPGADLSHKTFENYDLSGVNFRGVNLDGTSFINCNVDGADFTGANFTKSTEFDKTPIQNAIGIPTEYINTQEKTS